MERLWSRSREWGAEVGRGGVPAGRDLPESLPTACERRAWLLGADWRDGLDPADHPPPKKNPEILLRDGVGGKQMERPGRYLRNQKLKEEEEGGSYFHFSLDFPSPPASSFSGWP